MELRDYQIKAINAIKNSIRNGHKSPILRLDCGGGKTAIAANIAQSMAHKGTELLFLVHLQELMSQTYITFQKFNIVNDKIQVNTIITAGNNLHKYNPDVIICDECNFALAKSWRKVLDAYPKAIRIGLSATPVRLSGESMGDVFDDIIEVITADELIKQGYLCDYALYAPKLDFSTECVKTKCGDFDNKQLEDLLTHPKIYGDVLKYFQQYAHDRKTIVYCTTIKHSELTAEQFRNAGYNAVHFDGNTPDKKRKQIVERFRTGDIQILCNCNLISFGFDAPDCSCSVLLRPTQSLALYIQQAMRCLRGQQGKHAVILDFVGNAYRFGMPTEKRTYSLTGRIKCDNINAEPDVLCRQCFSCYRIYAGVNPICPYCGTDNGKTRKQIAADEKAELERIESLELKQKKTEERKAATLDELIALGKSRNYKNPVYWARKKFNNSWRNK